MKNIFLKVTILISWLAFNTPSLSYGQAKVQTIQLKKGEVLDILLLTQNPNTKADLKTYFQVAFPVAKRMSYQSLPGFRIIDHTQGNHRPGTLILGKWKNLKLREEFLSQIVKEVPDFHERRRKIWRFFGLRYFEMHEDFTLKINRGKYHVATAFWLDSNNKSSKMYKAWEKEVQKANGKVLVQLKDGKSPFGYQYNPHFFVITSWENETAFKAFQKKTQTHELNKIQHINEFILK